MLCAMCQDANNSPKNNELVGFRNECSNCEGFLCNNESCWSRLLNGSIVCIDCLPQTKWALLNGHDEKADEEPSAPPRCMKRPAARQKSDIKFAGKRRNTSV